MTYAVINTYYRVLRVVKHVFLANMFYLQMH
jgi:hypothetical protein